MLRPTLFVLLAACCLRSLSAQVPQPAPKAIDAGAVEIEREKPPMEDRVTAERDRNLTAYVRDYLPARERLQEHHRGEWVAIVSGKLVPRGPQGQIEPIKDLEKLDRQTRASFPKAKHRFMIRIGDEGDRTWGLGMTNKRFTIGGGFLNGIAKGFQHAAAGGFWIVDGDTKTSVWSGGPDHDTAPFVGPAIQPPHEAISKSTDPESEPPRIEKQIPLLFTNLCEGTALLGAESLDGFDVELWELPGHVRVNGLSRRGLLRRVWVHFRFDGTKYAFVQHVALWPAPRERSVEPAPQPRK
ncbi:MAG: hypothetical protein H6832_04055 [Planctomycetes bacterium]|nr:hypothetical protein [Planctomycetota bacterium]MCB9892622.1 hypothetical protein [Planctomycetota bacterium]MCB9917556.1 hypothetical protein [Planctomycetota bacterium]